MEVIKFFKINPNRVPKVTAVPKITKPHAVDILNRSGLCVVELSRVHGSSSALEIIRTSPLDPMSSMNNLALFEGRFYHLGNPHMIPIKHEFLKQCPPLIPKPVNLGSQLPKTMPKLQNAPNIGPAIPITSACTENAQSAGCSSIVSAPQINPVSTVFSRQNPPKSTKGFYLTLSKHV